MIYCFLYSISICIAILFYFKLDYKICKTSIILFLWLSPLNRSLNENPFLSLSSNVLHSHFLPLRAHAGFYRLKNVFVKIIAPKKYQPEFYLSLDRSLLIKSLIFVFSLCISQIFQLFHHESNLIFSVN